VPEREALPGGHAYRFMIHDRDCIFSKKIGQRGNCDGSPRVANTRTGTKSEGLRFILHFLGTLSDDLVHQAAFGELHTLRFAGWVVARVLEQTRYCRCRGAPEATRGGSIWSLIALILRGLRPSHRRSTCLLSAIDRTAASGYIDA
jgi:hypothetical protein